MHRSLVEEALRELVEDQNAPAVFVPFNYESGALDNAQVVKTGASYLYGFTVHSTLGAGQFIMIFDADAVPADTAVCSMVYAIGAESDREVAWIPPRRMDQGIVICNSTTNATKTLGAADCLFDVQYV